MTTKKSVHEREMELRSLLATPAGQQEVQELAQEPIRPIPPQA
jgi:hypothetical protein